MAAKKIVKAPAKAIPKPKAVVEDVPVKGKIVLKTDLSDKQRERIVVWAKKHGFETVEQTVAPEPVKKKKSK